MTTTTEKVAALQAVMKDQNMDAWIIPSSDPHESEYSADHWSGRGWLSGFSGSAGTVVIQQDKAALWTDGRYFLQAEQELAGTGIELMREGQSGVPSISQWLVDTLAEGGVVGFDGKVMPLTKVRELQKKLSSKNLSLKTDQDLLKDIWTDRPPMPANPVFIHDDAMAGLSHLEKLEQVRTEMQEAGADHLLIATLDDIAWLFNLRGSDIDCNPVFLAYALVTPENIQLFINDRRIEQDALQALQSASVQLHAYDAVASELGSLGSEARLMFDPATTCQWLVNSMPATVNTIEAASPTRLLKAIKNETEITRMNDCHRRDGVAIVRFMRWLEENIPAGTVTEVNLDQKLQSLRGEAAEYKGPSFPTIAGYGPHGAVIHYRADDDSSLKVEDKGLLLVDSGGQYPDGTTDITRTFACGEMTEEEKKDYTLVLKAHINLAKARFLKGTKGMQLDILARQPVWEAGQNYNHGTGHGVGYFLNVHEGPHSVSPKWIDEPLQPGMLITNEPGMYRNGKHGARIENIMLVTEDIETEFGAFYKLEALTLAPIDTRPLIREMLSEQEVNWLNDYHATVREELAPLLSGDDLQWLESATQVL